MTYCDFGPSPKNSHDLFVPIEVNIKQDFFNISIECFSKKNKNSDDVSHAILAGFSPNAGDNKILDYQWKRRKLNGHGFLERRPGRIYGEYTSDFPRKGKIDLQRKSTHLLSEIEVIKNKDGDMYIGCIFKQSDIYFWINQFKSSCKAHAEYENKRHSRDGEKFHLTIINPDELSHINVDNVTPFLNKRIWIRLVDIGLCKHNNNESYYLICTCDIINDIRRILLLDSKDPHITLGFNNLDIHGVSKDKTTKINRPIFDFIIFEVRLFIHKIRGNI